MEFTAKMIADFLGGEISGDENVKVSNVSKIEEGKEGTITFLSNPKYINYLYTTKASIVLINKDIEVEKPVGATLVKVDDAYSCLALLLELYNQAKKQKSGIESPSFISEGVKIPSKHYIGAFTYIGQNVQLGENFKAYPQVYIGDNVKIGNNVTLYAGVKIYNDCVLGDNIIVHAGAVIGADGFGFAPQTEGNYKKIQQIGIVVIEDNVEIGANTTIDRATMGETIIHQGVKLDNLIQVGHNCEIGENTVIAAQSGLAGSTQMGKNCMVGGQVGFAGHLSIADNSKFAGKTGVDKTLKKSGTYFGSPNMPYLNYFKSHAIFKKLPDLDRQVYELEKKIKELEEKLK